MSKTFRSIVFVIALTLIAAACSSGRDDSSATSSSSGDGQEATTSTESTTAESTTTDSSTTTETAAGGLSAKTCSAIVLEDLLADVFGDETVECGYVTVPADWADPQGATIDLAVYRVPATSADKKPDPVVYLEGGPGGSAVATVGEFSIGAASYLRADRDVIVIDQRGTGYSVPALFCTELADPVDRNGHQSCHDRLVAEGVDLADYNSVNNAKDLGAVREALDYDEWHLYGLSYGTRLALTAMRDEPNGIRSVVLDSVFPPQINGMSEVAYTRYWAIDQIAANCEADSDCTIDAKALIEDGIERLAASPVGILDAESYVGLLGELMSESRLPTLVTTVATGSDDEVTALIETIMADDDGEGATDDEDESGDSDEGDGGDDGIPPLDQLDPGYYPFVTEAVGMGYSVVCAEEAPFLDVTAGPVLGDDFRQTTREVIDAAPEPYASSLCSIWDVPSAGEIATLPVTSDIPTLILAGTSDTATPPAWSKLAGDTLANSIYLEFPGLTHGLLGDNDCLNGLTESFLADPTAVLDQACVATFPAVDYQAVSG